MGTNELKTQEKQRHGFVTFWLWLGIIGNVVSLIITMFSYGKMSRVWSLEGGEGLRTHYLILGAVAVIGGIALIICYGKILNWKKSGFWGAIIVAVIIGITNVILMNLIQKDFANMGLYVSLNPFTQVIATPLSLLILWAVLQIKKDGVSCWKLLE